MTPTNEEVWNQRGEKWGGRFTRHPVGWSFFVILLIVVVGSVAHFVGGWLSTAADIASPANVKKQYQVVIGDYQGLEASAGNACEVKEHPAQANSPTFLEGASLAYDAKYRQIAAEYNEHQHNLFEAELVGPKGYPHTAPSLSEMESKVC